MIKSQPKKNPENLKKTAKNKVRRIKHALLTAKGKAVDSLKGHLKKWESHE